MKLTSTLLFTAISWCSIEAQGQRLHLPFSITLLFRHKINGCELGDMSSLPPQNKIFFSCPSRTSRLLVPSSVHRIGAVIFFRGLWQRKPCAYHTLPCNVVVKNGWSSTSARLLCLSQAVPFIYIISVKVSLLYCSNASALFFIVFVFSADKLGLSRTNSVHVIVTFSPYRLCPDSSWRLRAEVVPTEWVLF
jgi:hypothetical protein